MPHHWQGVLATLTTMSMGPEPLGNPCFYRPIGVAVTAKAEYVYVSNLHGDYIHRINMKENTVVRVAGSGKWSDTSEGPALEAKISYPKFIAFDRDGYLVFADYSRSIFRLENDPPHGDPKNGTLVKLMDNIKGWPTGVAFHPSDGTAIIYTSTYCLYYVKFGDPDFKSTMIGNCNFNGFRDGAPDEARFEGDLSALWSPDGEVLFIGDQRNHRIRYMPRDLSFVATLAGTGIKGNNEGPGEEATLDTPYSLVLMGNSLYFTQDNGYNIRKIGTQANTSELYMHA